MELNDKVAIDNLCSWPLYFRRATGVGDVKVPANAKNFSLLDYAEIQTQIQLRNVFFVGTGDKAGDHASLYIVNDAQRKALLGLGEEEPETVLTDDSVRELLGIRKKDDFNKRLGELVTTPAEKRMIGKIAKEVGVEDCPAWKLQAINAVADENAI